MRLTFDASLRRLRHLAPALLVMALAGIGQAASDDVAALKACLGDGGDENCIGIVSEPCGASVGGATTLGTVDCMARERAAWEVILNQQWQLLKADARERDRWNEPAANDLPSAAESLAQAQRAWRAFRDAECLHAYAEWGSASFRAVAGAGCQMRITAKRAIEFQRKLGPDG